MGCTPQHRLQPGHHAAPRLAEQIDPVRAVEALGGLFCNATAKSKDTRINDDALVNGVLDHRHGRVAADDPAAISLGGRYTLSTWPQNSSWDFVAVGHDVEFWGRFLAALTKVDPDMAVNIEHEDAELGQLEGLEYAAQTLLRRRPRPDRAAQAAGGVMSLIVAPVGSTSAASRPKGVSIAGSVQRPPRPVAVAIVASTSSTRM